MTRRFHFPNETKAWIFAHTMVERGYIIEDYGVDDRPVNPYFVEIWEEGSE